MKRMKRNLKINSVGYQCRPLSALQTDSKRDIKDDPKIKKQEFLTGDNLWRIYESEIGK